MQQTTIAAELRTELKKGPTKQLRSAGKIPAVIYGHSAPLAVAVNAKEFNQKFSDIQANVLFNIDIDGDHRVALVKAIQEDILSDTINHVDFFEIEKGKTLRTTVPVHIEGTAPGVREGGMLEQQTHTLDIECMPKDIPSNISVDVSKLSIGESIHIGDLEIPEGVKILAGEDVTLVSITVLRSTEEPTDEDATEAVEAEVEDAESEE
jgi:large subunit ribosomal protein L25